MAGTQSWNDIYPGMSMPGGGPDAAPPIVQQASGGGTSSAAPAFSWVGLLILLIVLRVVWEWKGS